MTLSSSQPPSDGGESPLRTIRVLVCSGNLGNQQPDEDSLAAWIPYDGTLNEVVTEVPRYPVHHQDGTHDTTTSVTLQSAVRDLVAKTPPIPPRGVAPENKETENEEKACFDIIVIGMQEATFEVDSTVAGFAAISGASLLASQAYKAQKAVVGLTRAKDHLKSSRHDDSLRTGTVIKKSFRWVLGGSNSQQPTREDGFLQKKRPTLMFNGYAEQVASMYSNMDLKKFF